jgi:hypothetical protein
VGWGFEDRFWFHEDELFFEDEPRDDFLAAERGSLCLRSLLEWNLPLGDPLRRIEKEIVDKHWLIQFYPFRMKTREKVIPFDQKKPFSIYSTRQGCTCKRIIIARINYP